MTTAETMTRCNEMTREAERLMVAGKHRAAWKMLRDARALRLSVS